MVIISNDSRTALGTSARLGLGAILAIALGACAEGRASAPPAVTPQPAAANGQAEAQAASSSNAASIDATDAKLVQSLPGFKNEYATVNGVRLHYVIGGSGTPLVLLGGWPETWWEFHKMMPELAKQYRVIAVDFRGMGGSEKPAGGYDKKNMAKDIYELMQQLKFPQVYMAGHDIGSMVAYSFAANYPDATKKLILMDVAPADKSLMTWPILPQVNTFGDRIDPAHAFPWWFAFHQVKGLPEKMLEGGRISLEQDWIFHYLAINDASIPPEDRAVYATAYYTADAIRAGDAWYQTFSQDAIDDDGYAKINMPVLALGGPGYGWLKGVMTSKATNLRVVQVENSGHFIPEEQPDFATRAFIEFLGKP